MHERTRPVDRLAMPAALIAGISLHCVALAQHDHTTPAGAVQRFACENDGLIGGTPFGTVSRHAQWPNTSARRSGGGCRREYPDAVVQSRQRHETFVVHRHSLSVRSGGIGIAVDAVRRLLALGGG